MSTGQRPGSTSTAATGTGAAAADRRRQLGVGQRSRARRGRGRAGTTTATTCWVPAGPTPTTAAARDPGQRLDPLLDPDRGHRAVGAW